MEKIKPVKHFLPIVCAAATVGLLCIYGFTLLFGNLRPFSRDNSWTEHSGITDAANSCHAPPVILIPDAKQQNNKKADDDPVRSLIDDLKERTRVAAASTIGGGKFSSGFSAEEVAEWENRNPCRSRVELAPLYSLRKYAKDLPVNPLWEEVFQEYSNYHRTCMRAVGDIAKYFREGNSSTGCQFVVADAGEWIGVGNKLQVVANSILYGIITRRVILLPTSHLVAKYVCEPIVGSSWILDPATFPTPPQNNRDNWEMSDEVFKHIDQYKSSCHRGGRTSPPPWNLPYAAGDITNQKQPYQRFYCSTEQSFYSDITWVYLSGCIYTIPKIFAIPTFRPTLEALFPDKVVLTRLFRTMLLPADLVWSRVRRLYDTYLQPADRRVGIQMRYLLGATQYEELHELINRRVVDCLLSQGILPQLDKSPTMTSSVDSTNSTTIKVLVTSLYLSLHDQVTKMYLQHPTTSGETVAVIQLTHEDKQEYGVDVEIQAFTEILLLSLSDDLVLAPVSTFGGSAQTYGALTPWFIEYRKKEPLPSCERGRSVEVCNQYTSKKFECKYDRELGNKLFSKVVPFIEDCPQIEFPILSETEQGVHLRTTFLS